MNNWSRNCSVGTARWFYKMQSGMENILSSKGGGARFPFCFVQVIFFLFLHVGYVKLFSAAFLIVLFLPHKAISPDVFSHLF